MTQERDALQEEVRDWERRYAALTASVAAGASASVSAVPDNCVESGSCAYRSDATTAELAVSHSSNPSSMMITSCAVLGPDYLGDSHSLEGQYGAVEEAKARHIITGLQDELALANRRIEELYQITKQLTELLRCQGLVIAASAIMPVDNGEIETAPTTMSSDGRDGQKSNTVSVMECEKDSSAQSRYVNIQGNISTLQSPASVCTTLPSLLRDEATIQSSFLSAAEIGNWRLIVQCLGRDASLAQLWNEDGRTALHLICCQSRHADCSIEPVVEILLELKADPNHKDHNGVTSVMLACAHSNWAIAVLLVRAGGDLNISCRLTEGMRKLVIKWNHVHASTLEESHFTASDLLTSATAPVLFAAFAQPPSKIPKSDRHRCMNCHVVFSQKFMFSWSNKHDCGLCRRVVCSACLASGSARERNVFKNLGPEYICSNRLCQICQTI